MCLWSVGFLTDWVIDQKLGPFLLIFSAIFFDYSSLNLILVCSFKFRKSKKQWLLIQYWLFHPFWQPNSYQKALENVVLFQVIITFGPLYCNIIAPTPHRWEYQYTRIEKYTFSDYDYWYDWWIKLDHCLWSDNCK